MKSLGKVQILSLCGVFVAILALLGVYSYFVPAADAFVGTAENVTKTETSGIEVLSARPTNTDIKIVSSICQNNCEAPTHPASNNQSTAASTEDTLPTDTFMGSEQPLPPQITPTPAPNPDTSPTTKPGLTPKPIQPDPCGCQPGRHCLMSANKVCPVRNLN